MYCYVRNISGSESVFHGKTLQNNEEYLLNDRERSNWSCDEGVLQAIANSDLQVGNGNEWVQGISEQIDIIKGISRRTLDDKMYIHQTSRPFGTVTTFTSKGDSTSDSTVMGTDVGSGSLLKIGHNIGDDYDQTQTIDFNVMENETYIHEGYITWKGAEFDRIQMDFVTATTDYTTATGSNFNLHGGYMLVPAAGDGSCNPVGRINLVESVISRDYGTRVLPAYWNCPYDSTTHTFGDLTAAPGGDGQYNIFTQEIEMASFCNDVLLLDNGFIKLQTSDIHQIGHGWRMRLISRTDSTADHVWQAGITLTLNREKTC